MAASQAAIFVSVEDVAIRLGIAHGSAWRKISPLCSLFWSSSATPTSFLPVSS